MAPTARQLADQGNALLAALDAEDDRIAAALMDDLARATIPVIDLEADHEPRQSQLR